MRHAGLMSARCATCRCSQTGDRNMPSSRHRATAKHGLCCCEHSADPARVPCGLSLRRGDVGSVSSKLQRDFWLQCPDAILSSELTVESCRPHRASASTCPRFPDTVCTMQNPECQAVIPTSCEATDNRTPWYFRSHTSPVQLVCGGRSPIRRLNTCREANKQKAHPRAPQSAMCWGTQDEEAALTSAGGAAATIIRPGGPLIHPRALNCWEVVECLHVRTPGLHSLHGCNRFALLGCRDLLLMRLETWVRCGYDLPLLRSSRHAKPRACCRWDLSLIPRHRRSSL